MKYEFLDHTADVKFKAYGKTLEEAFENAALATFSIMTDIGVVKEVKEFEVNIKSTSYEALLYDFLDELIYLLDTESFLLKYVKSLSIDSDSLQLRAVLVGDCQDKIEDYEVHTFVKAVTYNDMYIKKVDDGYELQVVHDI